MNRIKVFSILTFCLLFVSKSSLSAQTVYESENLKIENITENVFVHISYLKTNDYGKVACNGMIFIHNKEAIVFDTPTDDQASTELINWIQNELGSSIKAVVVSHFHVDCLGGLNAFHTENIKSYANNATIDYARINESILPENGFKNEIILKLGDKIVLNKFFGEGHTRDNIVSYIPSEKVLFGGCLIKGLNARKGNLADANVDDWSNTVRDISKTFDNIEYVTPGHGESAGPELLTYTMKLFKQE